MLKGSSHGSGSAASDSPGREPSLYVWQPQSVLVRGWAPFGCRPSAKIDRVEYKKLSEELLKLLPDCLRNQVVVRAPFCCKLPVSA